MEQSVAQLISGNNSHLPIAAYISTIIFLGITAGAISFWVWVWWINKNGN